MLGIDSPNRGNVGHDEAKSYLTSLIIDKELSLEYDTYQDDKFGRIPLSYVWIPSNEAITI